MSAESLVIDLTSCGDISNCVKVAPDSETSNFRSQYSKSEVVKNSRMKQGCYTSLYNCIPVYARYQYCTVRSLATRKHSHYVCANLDQRLRGSVIKG